VDIEHPLAFIFIQQQIFYVRKQSVSNKSFMCESKASATNLFCAKAKRQLQKTSTFEDGEMNEDKASGGCHVQTLNAIKPRRN